MKLSNLRATLLNPPHRTSLRYRLGTRRTFLVRMLEELRFGDLEGVLGDTTNPFRAISLEGDDNLLRSWLDATATTADVLTFYQERLFNEGFIETATQADSVVNLLATIAAPRVPAVSASVPLAVTVRGYPDPTSSVLVPAGTGIQAVPSSKEVPPTFETSEALDAAEIFNALSPQPAAAEGATLLGEVDTLLLSLTSPTPRPGDRLALSGTADDGAAVLQALEVASVKRAFKSGAIFVQTTKTLGGGSTFQTLRGATLTLLGTRLSVVGASLPQFASASDARKLAAGAPRVGGVATFADASGDAVALSDGLPTSAPSCAAILPSGTVLAGTVGGGLWRRDAEGWAAVVDLNPKCTVTCLYVGAEGWAWVGTATGSVYRSLDDGRGWEPQPASPGRGTASHPTILPRAPVRGMTRVRHGERGMLVVALDSGVYRLEDGATSWEVWNRGLPGVNHQHAQPSEPITGIAAVDRDPDGLLLATGGGVYRATPGTSWQRATAPPVAIVAVASVGGAALAAPAAGGLVLTRDFGRRWEAANGDAGTLASEKVIALAMTATAWLAASATALWRSLDQGATWATVDAGLEGASPLALCASGAGVGAAAPWQGYAVAQWPGYDLIDGQLDVEETTLKLPDGALVLLEQSGLARAVQRVSAAAVVSERIFGVDARFTRLSLDPGLGVSSFDRALVTAYAQSQTLTLSNTQLTGRPGVDVASLDALSLSVWTSTLSVGDLSISSLTLPGQIDGLVGRRVLVLGQRPRVYVQQAGLELVDASGDALPLAVGDVLWLLSVPQGDTWSVQNADGDSGTLQVSDGAVTLLGADAGDPTLAEVNGVASSTLGGSSTVMALASPLSGCYDPATLSICANVVYATHGRTTTEILGDGRGREANQRFTLKGYPISCLDGETSVLDVQVNGASWSLVSTLEGQSPTARVYSCSFDADGVCTVRFGDGVNGARLPTGTQNISAIYRVGAGSVGNVAAGALVVPIRSVPGLRRISNPIAASGGTDAGIAAQLTAAGVPVTRVLRDVVSDDDYAGWLLERPGVARVAERALWDDAGRLLHLSVAQDDGAVPDQGDLDAYTASLSAVQAFPARILVAAFRPVAVRLKLAVRSENADIADAVRAALMAALGFDARRMVQPMTGAEVLAAAMGVGGVLDARLVVFERQDRPRSKAPGPGTELEASHASVSGQGADATYLSAEMLYLSDTLPPDVVTLP